MTTFSIQLGQYLCRYDRDLQLVKVWDGDARVIITPTLEDKLWADHAEEIQEAAVPVSDNDVDYYSFVPQRHR